MRTAQRSHALTSAPVHDGREEVLRATQDVTLAGLLQVAVVESEIEW